jgi:hypothetical protein
MRINYRHSEETKRKISESQKGEKSSNFGKTFSEETRKRMSLAKQGTRPSEECIRRSLEVRMSRPVSEETRRKIGNAAKGRVLSEEHKRKISQSQIGKKMSEEAKKKIGDGNRGKLHTEEQNRKNSETHKGFVPTLEQRKKQSDALKGDKCYLWKGGISYEPYCVKFNKGFKERVRAFFDNKCVGCGAATDYRLHIHHVNFNKMTCCNDERPLFVPLCRSCHCKTNHDREYWEKFYTKIITEKYGGKCYEPKTN